jgi:hypothetical protein
MRVALIAPWLLCAALIASPSEARRSVPTPGGIWVDLHFVESNGKPHLVIVPLTIYRATDADKECADEKGLRVLARGEELNDPRIATMTLVSAGCERDAKGQVKVAVGNWPKGKGPSYTEEPGFSVNVQGDAFKGAPAVVVLHFVATNGHHVNTVFGYSAKAAFYMKSCAAKLPGMIPSLIAQAQFSRTATASPSDEGVRPYSLNGLKFLGAECVAPPKMIGDLGWPKASVEFGFL